MALTCKNCCAEMRSLFDRLSSDASDPEEEAYVTDVFQTVLSPPLPAAIQAPGGLLRRTCEEPAVSEEPMARGRSWRDVEDPVANEDPRNLHNGLLQRTCESRGPYVEASEEEEEYMDSEDEQELLGNQLPQEEVARALTAYLAKHQSRGGEFDEDDDHAVEAGNPKLGFSKEPSEKYAALKKRTLLLSDDELFQVYIFGKLLSSIVRCHIVRCHKRF